MKVYKFFKIPDEDDNRHRNLEDKYILYAMTNNKKFAKRFKEDRNMKKFICNIHEDVTKEEYIEMCNENRGAILEVHPLLTVFSKKRIKLESITKSVLMTYTEKQVIDDYHTILDDESYWMTMPFPLIFKQRYISLLKELQYVTFYTIMTCGSISYKFEELLSKVNDDYSAPTLVPDEVALFISIFKDTL